MAVTPDNPLNMGPSMKLGEKSKANFTRPVSIERQFVSVWDPEGNEHKVMRQNANDLIHHAKWSAKPPIVKVISADETETNLAENTDPDQGVSPDVTELDEAMTALQALRDEAEALGIKVGARWGKKRLTTEITAIKATVVP